MGCPSWTLDRQSQLFGLKRQWPSPRLKPKFIKPTPQLVQDNVRQLGAEGLRTASAVAPSLVRPRSQRLRRRRQEGREVDRWRPRRSVQDRGPAGQDHHRRGWADGLAQEDPRTGCKDLWGRGQEEGVLAAAGDQLCFDIPAIISKSASSRCHGTVAQSVERPTKCSGSGCNSSDMDSKHVA